MPMLPLADARIHYELTGAGEPVVFIQGIGVAGSGWAQQTQALAQEYACVSFDNRGLGKSECAAGPLTIEQMAADTLRLMDALGFAGAHVVGHSMGGIIAQELALAAPERVRSLALLCTFSTGAEGARLTPQTLWMGLRTRIGTRAMRRRAFLEMVFPRDYLAGRDAVQLAAELAPLMGRDLADQPPVLMRQLQALGRYDASARLAVLGSMPVLVVSAEHDPIARPEYGQRLARAIPCAEYVELPGASHAVILQEPAVVNDLLRRHFAGTRGRKD